MELHIKDRLYLQQLLPAEGNFMEFATKRAIIKKISITKEEQDTFELKEVPEEGKLTWNSETDMKHPINVDFTADELNYLRKGCEALVDTPKPDDFWLTVEKIYNS